MKFRNIRMCGGRFAKKLLVKIIFEGDFVTNETNFFQ